MTEARLRNGCKGTAAGPEEAISRRRLISFLQEPDGNTGIGGLCGTLPACQTPKQYRNMVGRPRVIQYGAGVTGTEAGPARQGHVLFRTTPVHSERGESDGSRSPVADRFKSVNRRFQG